MITDSDIKPQGNLVVGVIAGAIVGVIGAIVWALIATFTGYIIGWIAMGIGAAVGVTIRVVGKGSDIKFGIAGAVIAFLACLLGDILSCAGIIAKTHSLDFFEVFKYISFVDTAKLIFKEATVMTYVIHLFAIIFGYRFAMNKQNDKEIVKTEDDSNPTNSENPNE